MQIKLKLANEIVRLYHGQSAALAAEEHFRTVFQKRTVPENPEELEVDAALLDNDRFELAEFLHLTGLAPSKSEARRLIQQGAVKLDGVKVTVLKQTTIKSGAILQIGKRKCFRFKVSDPV